MAGREEIELTAPHGVCAACAVERSRIPVVRLNLADDAADLLLRDALSRDEPEDEDARRAWAREAIARLMRRARRDPQTGCLVWLGGKYAKSAYGAIQYRGVKYRAHRLSFLAHKGAIPHGLLVCHACDNPACIAIAHLFLGTPKDNMTDMRLKGRGRFRSVLTIEQVVQVKRRLEDGAAMADVARETGIRYASVFAIGKGRIWRDVKAG